MKKKNLLVVAGVAGLSVMLLANCGDGNTTETVSGKVESDVYTETAEEIEETKKDVKKINQVVADNENFKITLIDIVKEDDDIWGKSIEVKFDVENKRADSIEVQARSVSADGRMVDETLVSMSDEIAVGKVGTARLSISEYEGYDFPELNSDLELTLHVFSWDDYDYQEDIPVKISF